MECARRRTARVGRALVAPHGGALRGATQEPQLIRRHLVGLLAAHAAVHLVRVRVRVKVRVRVRVRVRVKVRVRAGRRGGGRGKAPGRPGAS